MNLIYFFGHKHQIKMVTVSYKYCKFSFWLKAHWKLSYKFKTGHSANMVPYLIILSMSNIVTDLEILTIV